ncbi:hypothetical protein HMI56_006604 [Coelomomyces lativittatus]|nr:hypothetical protein HMI56_006604 [Coelomomyces lativittatus]
MPGTSNMIQNANPMSMYPNGLPQGYSAYQYNARQASFAGPMASNNNNKKKVDKKENKKTDTNDDKKSATKSPTPTPGAMRIPPQYANMAIMPNYPQAGGVPQVANVPRVAGAPQAANVPRVASAPPAAGIPQVSNAQQVPRSQ